MNYINNFRYGEISKKNAGRFDSEFYSQGAFEFKNAKTCYIGDCTRRPPLKKLVDVSGVFRIIQFSISESISYTILLKSKSLELYRYVASNYTKVTEINYTHIEDEDEITLDYNTAMEIRHAQYYTRMYFVHHTFRPFFIDVNPTTDTVSIGNMNILLNQYAKEQFWFTPSYVADSNGKEITSSEKRLVYKADGKPYTWYFDKDFTDPYLYSNTYPPIKGESAYITSYESYNDDSLLTAKGCYPSGISIINDSIYLYATDENPQVFWKSRTLGSSQWIEGYTVESMHDFIQFQCVTSEGKDIVDIDEFPKTEMASSDGSIMYEQSNGEDIWYAPDKNSSGQYTYVQRLYWKITDSNGEKKTFYIDSECTVEYDMSRGDPVRKPVMIYDLSDIDAIYKYTVSTEFIANDSCAAREEPNTGREDRIISMTNACGKIIINTSTSEKTIPSNFTPVSNRSLDSLTDYSSVNSYKANSFVFNNSFMFLQKGNILREFYLYQGYINDNDVTVLNHDIFDCEVIDITVKNTPDPMIYFTMEDGTMRALTYDKNNGIQSFSRWDFPTRSVISTCVIEKESNPILLALVNEGDSQWIGYFDENEKENYRDEGDVDYETVITTPYIEIHNTLTSDTILSFGKTKQVSNAYLRVIDTGRFIVLDDKRQENITPYAVGDDDYRMPLSGKANRRYSLTIKSFEGDPLNILAFGYEVI